MMPLELRAQERITRAFIEADPVEIILTPNSFVSDGKGGTVKTPAPPRQPQVARMIEGNAITTTTRPTLEGEQYVTEATLIMASDAKIEMNDTFTAYGREWQVTEIRFSNQYSVRAAVISRGR